MDNLLPGYFAEVDKIDEYAWYQILKRFGDANIYQTWAYDASSSGNNNISHLVLKRNGEIVAAAQSKIVKVPVLNQKIAYIRWGPMWIVNQRERSLEVFSQAILALYNEYVHKRGFILRLRPLIYTDESELFLPILKKRGFTLVTHLKSNRTLIKNLGPELETLRRGLKKKWRHYLNQAERNGLFLEEGYDDNLFEKFIYIYDELVKRKKFARPNDINEYRLIQRNLPNEFKMKIILCRDENNYCAGIVCSAIGNTGISLFRATNQDGRKNKGMYVTHWHALKWFKEKGCYFYDLNGINPLKNPGTYEYKLGFLGKDGKDVYFLGQFDSYPNLKAAFLMWILDNILKTKRLLTSKMFKKY